MKLGATPKAVTSRQRIQLGAELAVGAQQAGNAAVHAVENAGEDHAAQRPAPILADGEANSGQPEAKRQRSNGVGRR